MIDALYCRSTAVLLAMHVWLYVVAVLYMVSGAGRPHGAAGRQPATDADMMLLVHFFLGVAAVATVIALVLAAKFKTCPASAERWGYRVESVVAIKCGQLAGLSFGFAILTAGVSLV